MSTRGAIKIREKGEELRFFYGHDAYPDGLGHRLRRYLNMNVCSHQWQAVRIFNDLKNGKCLGGSFSNLHLDYDFMADVKFGGYEEYGYLIDCDKRTLTCYDLPGVPYDEEQSPFGNTTNEDWSGREVIELPYVMVTEDKTTERIKAAVADYLFGREEPKPFDARLNIGEHWTVSISVEFDETCNSHALGEHSETIATGGTQE